ncbi:MAG: asparagine synthase (glutamine-hydrolyzing) [Alphaproteobacteria bacterium]
MCGLCGIAGPAAELRPVEKMLSVIEHRGPDAQGVHAVADCVLGHRRLAIVDLSAAGNQPMLLDNGRTALVANGEIYNHEELRAELQREGHIFRSNSDNEVLLHGWRQWRQALFARINGMFACAIWDGETGELILARDRLGIKPLYYQLKDGSLTFASEMKAILAIDGGGRRIDHTGLAQFLTWQNMIGEATLIDGIRMIEAGSFLIFRNGTIRKETFWQPAIPSQGDTVKLEKKFEQAVGAFQTTLDASVGRHLMADVPVATYLSAGFDSAGVTASASRQSAHRLVSFTGSFDAGGWYDEAAGAAEVARHCGVEHRTVTIAPDDFANDLDDLIYHLDQPRMGMGAFAQYRVAGEIARTHKTVLTGHGGDELFSGYPVFKLPALCQAWRSTPLKALAALCRLRLSELPHLFYFALLGAGRNQRSPGLPTLFAPDLLRHTLRADIADRIAAAEPAAQLDQAIGAGETAYQRLLLTYLKVYLPGLLVVEDKISMAHSLEARTPLLDNAMVALALGVDPGIKLHGWQLKAIPKAALRPSLPDTLYRQPKRGFPTPLRLWLRGPLGAWLEERLHPERSPLTALFEPDALLRMVRGFRTSWTRHARPLDEIGSHRIWMLLSLDAWLRNLDRRLGVQIAP